MGGVRLETTLKGGGRGASGDDDTNGWTDLDTFDFATAFKNLPDETDLSNDGAKAYAKAIQEGFNDNHELWQHILDNPNTALQVLQKFQESRNVRDQIIAKIVAHTILSKPVSQLETLAKHLKSPGGFPPFMQDLVKIAVDETSYASDIDPWVKENITDGHLLSHDNGIVSYVRLLDDKNQSPQRTNSQKLIDIIQDRIDADQVHKPPEDVASNLGLSTKSPHGGEPVNYDGQNLTVVNGKIYSDGHQISTHQLIEFLATEFKSDSQAKASKIIPLLQILSQLSFDTQMEVLFKLRLDHNIQRDDMRKMSQDITQNYPEAAVGIKNVLEQMLVIGTAFFVGDEYENINREKDKEILQGVFQTHKNIENYFLSHPDNVQPGRFWDTEGRILEAKQQKDEETSKVTRTALPPIENNQQTTPSRTEQHGLIGAIFLSKDAYLPKDGNELKKELNSLNADEIRNAITLSTEIIRDFLTRNSGNSGNSDIADITKKKLDHLKTIFEFLLAKSEDNKAYKEPLQTLQSAIFPPEDDWDELDDTQKDNYAQRAGYFIFDIVDENTLEELVGIDSFDSPAFLHAASHYKHDNRDDEEDEPTKDYANFVANLWNNVKDPGKQDDALEVLATEHPNNSQSSHDDFDVVFMWSLRDRMSHIVTEGGGQAFFHELDIMIKHLGYTDDDDAKDFKAGLALILGPEFWTKYGNQILAYDADGILTKEITGLSSFEIEGSSPVNEIDKRLETDPRWADYRDSGPSDNFKHAFADDTQELWQNFKNKDTQTSAIKTLAEPRPDPVEPQSIPWGLRDYMSNVIDQYGGKAFFREIEAMITDLGLTEANAIKDFKAGLALILGPEFWRDYGPQIFEHDDHSIIRNEIHGLYYFTTHKDKDTPVYPLYGINKILLATDKDSYTWDNYYEEAVHPEKRNFKHTFASGTQKLWQKIQEEDISTLTEQRPDPVDPQSIPWGLRDYMSNIVTKDGTVTKDSAKYDAKGFIREIRNMIADLGLTDNEDASKDFISGLAVILGPEFWRDYGPQIFEHDDSIREIVDGLPALKIGTYKPLDAIDKILKTHSTPSYTWKNYFETTVEVSANGRDDSSSTNTQRPHVDPDDLQPEVDTVETEDPPETLEKGDVPAEEEALEGVQVGTPSTTSTSDETEVIKLEVQPKPSPATPQAKQSEEEERYEQILGRPLTSSEKDSLKDHLYFGPATTNKEVAIRYKTIATFSFETTYDALQDIVLNNKIHQIFMIEDITNQIKKDPANFFVILNEMISLLGYQDDPAAIANFKAGLALKLGPAFWIDNGKAIFAHDTDDSMRKAISSLYSRHLPNKDGVSKQATHVYDTIMLEDQHGTDFDSNLYKTEKTWYQYWNGKPKQDPEPQEESNPSQDQDSSNVSSTEAQSSTVDSENPSSTADTQPPSESPGSETTNTVDALD